MKKNLSVWMLLARSTFWRIAALLALLVGAESLLLTQAARTLPALDAAEMWSEQFNLEALFAESRIPMVCGAAFALLLVILLLPDWQWGAKPDYTLHRLQVSPRQIFFCRAAYGTLCLLLFWMVNAAALTAMLHHWGGSLFAETYNQQTLMLACYRVKFLHGLMPLADWPVLVRNLAFMLLLGVLAGRGLPEDGRHIPFGLIFTAAAVMWLFPTGLSDWKLHLTLSVVALAILAVSVMGEMRKEADHEL